MAVLLGEDFETGTTSMELVVDGGCSLEITPIAPIQGLYSARCGIFSQPQWTSAVLQQAITPIPKVYAELLVRIDSFTPTGDAILGSVISFTGEAANILNVGLNGNRQLLIEYRHAGLYTRLASATVLELGVPYKVNVEVSVGSAAPIRVSINGVEITDLAVDVDDADARNLAAIGIGAGGGYNVQAVVLVDDFIISDTPLPIRYHQLSIGSTPISGVPFTVE